MDSGRGKSRKRKAPECWLQDGHSRGADQKPITIASLVGPTKPFNAAAGFVKGRKESDEKQAEYRRIRRRIVRKKTIESNERKQRELAQRHEEAVADLEKVQRQYDEATASCEQRRAYEVVLRDKEVPRHTQNVTQLPSEQSPHVPLLWATEGQLEAEIGKESQRKVKGPPKTYELNRNLREAKQKEVCMKKEKEHFEKAVAVLDFDREKKEINDRMKSLQREKEAVEKLKKNNDRIDRELAALNGQFGKEAKEGGSEEFGEVTSYGIKFSLDEDFTEDLNDPKSEAYREVEGRVSDMMKRAIGDDLKEVVVIGFKNGSIEVTLKIIVKKDGNNVDDIKKKMQILEYEVQSSMKVQESSTAVVVVGPPPMAAYH